MTPKNESCDGSELMIVSRSSAEQVIRKFSSLEHSDNVGMSDGKRGLISTARS